MFFEGEVKDESEHTLKNSVKFWSSAWRLKDQFDPAHEIRAYQLHCQHSPVLRQTLDSVEVKV